MRDLKTALNVRLKDLDKMSKQFAPHWIPQTFTSRADEVKWLISKVDELMVKEKRKTS